MKFIGVFLAAVMFSGQSLTAGELKQFEEPWFMPLRDDHEQMLELLKQFETNSVGRQILSQTMKQLKVGFVEDLVGFLEPGETSNLDTSLSRRLSPETGKETYEIRKRLFINKYLSRIDALMDLAHELTHYNEKPDFNPYVDTWPVWKYVQATIDGKGGEVDAFMAECKYYLSLKIRPKKVSRCENYLSSNGELDRMKIVSGFYRVGKHLSEIKSLLQPQDLNRLPAMVPEYPEFISSVGQSPYPMALVREYKTILDVACRNNKRRLEVQKTLSGTAAANFKQKTESFISTYCPDEKLHSQRGKESGF